MCPHPDESDDCPVPGTCPQCLKACCNLAGLCRCRFFEDYKKNENKEVKVDEILGAEEARKTISESMVSLVSILISMLISE